MLIGIEAFSIAWQKQSTDQSTSFSYGGRCSGTAGAWL